MIGGSAGLAFIATSTYAVNAHRALLGCGDAMMQS